MLSAVPQATALRTNWREATVAPRRWPQRLWELSRIGELMEREEGDNPGLFM